MPNPEKSTVVEWFKKLNTVTIAVGLLGIAGGVVFGVPGLATAFAIGVGIDAGAGYAVNEWDKRRKR